MDLNQSLLESLYVVSEAVTLGRYSDSVLIKACEKYKKRINFTEDKKYQIIKAKTFSNFLRGVDNSKHLMKALILGETKVVNGITYVVKQTPSGKLDWRVANKQKKSTKKNSASVDLLFDVQDFPTSSSDISFVQKLGGSTGAELVEDKNGNKYVKKGGASSGYVKEEFLANCIYSLMGVKTPTMKLYEENGKSFILSKFIDNTTDFHSVKDDLLIEDVCDNYVLDCLLANWDIYKNDNILIDTNTDEIIRVDNGGSLRYSAQGRDKGDHFTDEVDEIETMLINNPFLASAVTTAKIESQIKAIQKNKTKILSLIDDPDLKLKMSLRIASLKQRLSPKSSNLDPYRELSEKELQKAYDDCNGNLYSSNPLTGWKFLSTIAKMRKFDEVPSVLDEEEFEKLKKGGKHIFLNRGLTAAGGRTAKKLMKEFCESEHCFYGMTGMYGAGIYSTVNKSGENKGGDYDIALSYAGGNHDHVLDILIPKDANIIDANELDDMMNEEFFGDEFKELKKEYDGAVEELNKLKKKQEDIEKDVEINVKKELGWDEKTLKVLMHSKPEQVYADINKYPFQKILRYYTPIIKNLNGKITKIDDKNYEISVPNSGETFLLNRNSVEDENALKQKSEHSSKYNYQYVRLKKFLMQEHFSKIRGKVDEAVKEARNTDPNLLSINQKVKDFTQEVRDLADTVNLAKTNGSNTLNQVMAAIARRPGGEFRGYYAAIKGYDAVIQKNGWGGKTDFCVILNRSKLIVKEVL